MKNILWALIKRSTFQFSLITIPLLQKISRDISSSTGWLGAVKNPSRSSQLVVATDTYTYVFNDRKDVVTVLRVLDLVLWQACERKDYYSLVLLVVLFEGDREWRIWFHVSICPNSLVGTKLTHRNTDFDIVILVLLVKRLKQNNLFYAFPHFFSLWLFEVLPTL